MMIFVGASIAYKIVKMTYIALQRKSLKIKEELNRDRVDRKGTDSIAESAHTKWSLPSGSGDHPSLRSPAQDGL